MLVLVSKVSLFGESIPNGHSRVAGDVMQIFSGLPTRHHSSTVPSWCKTKEVGLQFKGKTWYIIIIYMIELVLIYFS